jgi:hygromycin-B 7''-O-kinase
MLPAVGTDEEWQAVVFDEKIVRPAAEDLAARLGLAGAGLRRYPGGSRPVYAVGGRRVLKLYPTVSAPDSVTEARVLDYLNGRLPVATPELLAHGEYENGWRYVLMSQLPGTELAAAWPAIPRPHQDRVVSEAGDLLAALHGLDPEPLHGILGPADWAGFLTGQRATAPQRQREAKLPGPVAQSDPGFPGIGAADTRAGAGAVAHRGDTRASDGKPRYLDAERAAGLRDRDDR